MTTGTVTHLNEPNALAVPHGRGTSRLICALPA